MIAQDVVPVSSSGGVQAYGELPIAGQMSITANQHGETPNGYVVEILDTLGTGNAGNETQVWTENRLTINVEAGASTIAQVLAAAGGITGTPWGTLAAIAAGNTAVAAMAATALRDLPNAILGAMPTVLEFNLDNYGPEAKACVLLSSKNVGVNPVRTVVEMSDNNFKGVKAYGESNGEIGIEALVAGDAYNEYTVVVSNTVQAGNETVTWTQNSVTIAVEAGVSTIKQVLEAAAAPVGTPWGIITAVVAEDTEVTALASTAISGLTNYRRGVNSSKIAVDNNVLVPHGIGASVIAPAYSRLRVGAVGSAGAPSKLEINLVTNY
jgi:hypothetical protein